MPRHGGSRRTCPSGDTWTATYGSFAGQVRDRTVWLDERPERWGGSWATGCSVCAQFEQQRASPAATPRASTPGSTPRGRQSSGMRGNTRWCRYEVCHASLAASHVGEHAEKEGHKLAVLAYQQPDLPVRMLLQTTASDEQLLAGAVPQPADWMRAWRVCMDPVSWRTAANMAGTEHFIAQIRDQSVKPRAIQNMVRCMTEALRQRKRQWLDKAKWIFLGFDDKNGRKLLRFKCDVPNETRSDAVASATCSDAVANSAAADPCWQRYGARMGVLGCMPVGLETGIEEYERDHAERTSEEIVNLTQRFCTPRGEALDAQWFESVLAKVADVVVDGALLKTA